MNLAQRAKRVTSYRMRATRLRADVMRQAEDGRFSAAGHDLRQAEYHLRLAQRHLSDAVAVARRERREAGERALPK